MSKAALDRSVIDMLVFSIPLPFGCLYARVILSGKVTPVVTEFL